MRLLVRLLVLTMVPVLILAIPAARGAQATETASAQGTVHSDGRGYDPTDGWTCNYKAVAGTVPLSGPGLGGTTRSYVRGSLSCAAGSFPGQRAYAKEVTIGGAGCSFGASGADIGSFTAEGTGAPGCALTAICISVKVTVTGGFDADEEQVCGSITLVVPSYTAPVAGCPVGVQVAGSMQLSDNGAGGYGNYKSLSVPMTYSSQSNVILILWMRMPGGNIVKYDSGSRTYGPGTVTADYGVQGDISSYTLLGGQVIVNNPWPTGGSPNGWSANPPWDFGTLHTEGASDRAMGGMSRAERCSWYFGTKIASDSTSTADEPTSGSTVSEPPAEDTTAPPAVDPATSGSGCEGFSFTDPSSWAGAGICVLVKAINAVIGILSRIAGLLGGIAAAIVEGIIDGLTSLLRTLFVPSDGFLEDKVDGVKEAWEHTAPGELLDTVTSLPGQMNPPASSGCSGPTMPLDFGSMGGQQSFQPLSTCGAFAGRLSIIVHLGLQVLLWVGGVLLALRILAGSLGYNTQLAGRGDD